MNLTLYASTPEQAVQAAADMLRHMARQETAHSSRAGTGKHAMERAVYAARQLLAAADWIGTATVERHPPPVGAKAQEDET